MAAFHEGSGELSDIEDARLVNPFNCTQNENRKGSNTNPRCLLRATWWLELAAELTRPREGAGLRVKNPAEEVDRLVWEYDDMGDICDEICTRELDWDVSI